MNGNEYMYYVNELTYILDLYEKDQEYGGITYYAVDNDVIKMYGDYMTLTDDYNYVKVFPDDREEDRAALAWSIAKYIFEYLRGPIFILKPHDQELKCVLYSIMNVMINGKDEGNSGIYGSYTNIQYIIDRYYDSVRSEKDEINLIKELEESVLCVLSQINEKNVSSEFIKISDLLKKERIRLISSYTDEDGWFFPEIYEKTNIQHREYLDKQMNEWFQRLIDNRSLKSPIKSWKFKDKLFVDAEVIARLIYINKNIEKDDKRLLFITGDRKIHNAAKKVIWSDGENVADKFIRYPKYFLAAKDLFRTDKSDFETCDMVKSEKDNFFAEWFSVGIKSMNNHDLSQIKNVWNEFLRRNVLLSGFERMRAPEIKNIFKKGDNYNDIKEIVDKKLAETWFEFWKIYAKIGYWAMKDIEKIVLGENSNQKESERLFPLRGIPALRLTYYRANKYIEELCEKLAHQKYIKDKKYFDLLEKEDNTFYTAFLIYGLAFGAAGKWSISCILSEIALIISDNIQIKKTAEMHEPITGNEAAYLLAWSIRHNAQNIGELDRAKRMIVEAYKRKEKADIIINEYKSLNLNKICNEDFRYECEDIGIDIAINMYKYFKADQYEIYKNEHKVILCRSIYKCMNDSKRIIKAIGGFKNNDISKLQNNLIGIMIRRQALTYYYLSCIILKYIDNKYSDKIDKDFARKNLRLYYNVINYKYYKIKSYLNNLIYYVSLHTFGEDEGDKVIIDDVHKGIDKGNVESYYVMEYDEKLYQFLLRILSDAQE